MSFLSQSLLDNVVNIDIDILLLHFSIMRGRGGDGGRFIMSLEYLELQCKFVRYYVWEKGEC